MAKLTKRQEAARRKAENAKSVDRILEDVRACLERRRSLRVGTLAVILDAAGLGRWTFHLERIGHK